jgi:hypothetical protein
MDRRRTHGRMDGRTMDLRVRIVGVSSGERVTGHTEDRFLTPSHLREAEERKSTNVYCVAIAFGYFRPLIGSTRHSITRGKDSVYRDL